MTQGRHKATNQFIAPAILELHMDTRDGIHRKACKKCLRERKQDSTFTVSGRINERCRIHPDEYLWLAGTREEWDNFRNHIKQMLNPGDPAIMTEHWETIGSESITSFAS